MSEVPLYHPQRAQTDLHGLCSAPSASKELVQENMVQEDVVYEELVQEASGPW